MKNYMKKILTGLALILGPVVIAFSQPTPPAPDPVLPGPNDPRLSCGVPIGEGYWILLALAVAYIAYKYWQVKRAEKVA
jgi:hypothetical protein